MIGVMVPAIIVNGQSDRSSDAPAVVIPVIEPSTDALSACASLSRLVPCSTESLALKLASATATQLPLTPAPQDSPAPTPLPEPEVTAEPLPTMEVREGDTLLDLAAFFGVTPFDIAVANGMAVDDYLQIGQTLAIPVPAAVFSIPPDPMAAVAVLPAPNPVPVQPPAAPVVTDPPPPPPPPYVPPSSSDVVAAICSFPWPCETMIRIATCESGLNPRAVNPAGYYGLFQIDRQFPGWDDPLTNASVAYYEKYLPTQNRGGDGLAHWPVCRYY